MGRGGHRVGGGCDLGQVQQANLDAARQHRLGARPRRPFSEEDQIKEML